MFISVMKANNLILQENRWKVGIVAPTCFPSYLGGSGRGIECSAWTIEDSLFQNLKTEKAKVVAQCSQEPISNRQNKQVKSNENKDR